MKLKRLNNGFIATHNTPIGTYVFIGETMAKAWMGLIGLIYEDAT